MKILLTGNCQTTGIAYFLRRALPTWEIHDLPHLGTFYGHISEEEIAREHEWADMVFFHHKHDGNQDHPVKQPKIPLSVWYQAAPFMAQIQPEMWSQLNKDCDLFSPGYIEPMVEYVVREHDFDYEKRWKDCWEKMRQKEEDECVPDLIRMSDTMEEYGRKFQLQLTCNHPTSLVFRTWAQKILSFLGKFSLTVPTVEECLENPNLAGLPCEESATSGARKHLQLQWGGRDIDDESGRQIARERLNQ